MEWVNDWVKYWMGGEGNFVILVMEEMGIYYLLDCLYQSGLVDKD